MKQSMIRYDRLKELVWLHSCEAKRRGYEPIMSSIARKLRVNYGRVVEAYRELAQEGRLEELKDDDDPQQIHDDDPVESPLVRQRLADLHAAKLRQFDELGRWQGLDEDQLHRVLPS